MDFDELFREGISNTKYDVPKDPIILKVDKLVVEIENNYQNIGTVYAEREKEKEDLKAKVSEAEKKLAAIKNPRNLASMPAQRREAMNKKLSDARDVLRKEIQRCKVRLDEIKIEEGGNGGEKESSSKSFNNPSKNNKNTPKEQKPDQQDQQSPQNQQNKWNMNPYNDFM